MRNLKLNDEMFKNEKKLFCFKLFTSISFFFFNFFPNIYRERKKIDWHCVIRKYRYINTTTTKKCYHRQTEKKQKNHHFSNC